MSVRTDNTGSEREVTPFPNVRIIKDPIYDIIEVDTFLTQFIDTRQFQRLRNIKQLGTSYYVFPGASHNRFEHCLGVMHLARLMVDHLALQSGLNITERDRRCVQLAGLLHDLGHGPFSHVFDGQFIPRARPGYNWKHEDASELMFEALLEENEIEMPRCDIDFVRDLIAGVDRHPENSEKPFLFEIVANKQNGVDVDKFDYIARDTHQIGGDKCNLATLRLIKSSRVIGNHIAYYNKDITNVFLVFQERWSLHKRVYTHPAAKAIEYMVVDALIAADPYLRISEQVDDPKRYVFLTDAILEEIERSEQPELDAARELVTRLRRRQLYKCVDIVHLQARQEGHWKIFITSEKISFEANRVRSETPDASALREVVASDVIVDWTFVHFGMKDRNPVELVLFYGKYTPNTASHARPEEYSQTFPRGFSEIALRVFTRDRSLYGLVQAGFRAVQSQCQRIQSENPVNEPSSKTPLNASNALPSQDNNLSSADNIYAGNPFTSVPASFPGTASPKPRNSRPASQSIASLPPSGSSPILGLDTMGLRTAAESPHVVKRIRGSDNDTSGTTREPSKKKTKRG